MANENNRNAWSRADQKELKQLAEGNTPTGIIAMKLGRAEDAVRSKAQSLGASLNPPNRSPYNRGKK
jgi:hypothetical protein